MTAHTLKWKEAQLAEVKGLVSKYSVIGIANLEGFPAALFQTLRKKLAGKAVIKVSKTRVIKKALEEANLSSSGLLDITKGSVGIVFTDMNAFELYNFIKRNKGSAMAKEGAIAPEDIVVPAGDTGLPPGPALSDLKAAGLNVRVQGATIAVAQDKTVAKKGEAVSKPVANVLAKLDIKPLKVGLKISGVFENGELFKAEVLDIDSEQVFNDIVRAVQYAVNLSVETAYPTEKTIELILSKAVRQANALKEALPKEEKEGKKEEAKEKAKEEKPEEEAKAENSGEKAEKSEEKENKTSEPEKKDEKKEEKA